MIIVYQSKTGFTKKYAEMLAAKTGMKAYRVNEVPPQVKQEDVLFLGWMKAGRIQGLEKAKGLNLKGVCGSGTGRIAEPNEETVIARNKLAGIPFFYLRGGRFPLKDLKGMDRIMMSFFVKALEKRSEKDDRIKESISMIRNGFNGVKEENLTPVIDWLQQS